MLYVLCTSIYSQALSAPHRTSITKQRTANVLDKLTFGIEDRIAEHHQILLESRHHENITTAEGLGEKRMMTLPLQAILNPIGPPSRERREQLTSSTTSVILLKTSSPIISSATVLES